MKEKERENRGTSFKKFDKQLNIIRMKKNLIKILSIAIMGVLIASCSNPAKMAKNAQLVGTNCTPAVLEVIADEITATYDLTFPGGYFHPKAILEVVPVLVYQGGEVAAPTFKLQGEKITDNYRVIPSTGGKASNTIKFTYVPGMEKSHLELRVAVWNKLKKTNFPAPYKLADGANITYKLVNTTGYAAVAPNQYQKVIREQKETQIMYLVNKSDVRNSELTKTEIKEFEQFLAAIDKDERRVVNKTDIIAYASPEGPVDLNTKLSDNRSTTAKTAFDKITKNVSSAPVNVASVGEDWDGFQELVAASNIQDKELILRVLSMYSDPMVREREIKNMSVVFKTLADKILPELRRARMIANIDYTNYRDEELVDLSKTNIEIMDEQALLYTGTLVTDAAAKEVLYKKAGDKFGSDAGYINLAAVYAGENKTADAKSALSKVKDKNSAYYTNNAGVVALQEKNYAEAANQFAKSNLKEARYNEGILDILNGKYTSAVSKLAGEGFHNEVLAYLLTNQVDKADAVKIHECARCAYFKAIIAARRGNATEFAKMMEVVNTNEALKARAANDIEFARYR